MRTTILIAVLAALLGGCASPEPSETPKKDPRRLSDINVQLGIEYMKHNNLETALKKLKRALEYDSENPAAHTTLGTVYARIGELDKAEKHFALAVKYAPDDPNVYNNYGQFLCVQGRTEQGLRALKKALDLPLYRTPAIALTNEGYCELGAGRRDAAEKYFRSALQADPAFTPALLEMMKISVDKKEFLSARAYLQRYVEVADHNAQTLWLGVQIENALGDKDTASSYALALQSRFPESEEARLLLESKKP